MLKQHQTSVFRNKVVWMGLDLLIFTRRGVTRYSVVVNQADEPTITLFASM